MHLKIIIIKKAIMHMGKAVISINKNQMKQSNLSLNSHQEVQGVAIGATVKKAVTTDLSELVFDVSM